MKKKGIRIKERVRMEARTFICVALKKHKAAKKSTQSVNISQIRKNSNAMISTNVYI